MRTAGMIGGLGPESTIDYYRSIIARYRARKPDGGYPHVIINSLDVDKGIALLNAGRLDDLTGYLSTGVELLVRAGADFGSLQRTRRISCSTKSSAGRLSLLSASCAPPPVTQRHSA